MDVKIRFINALNTCLYGSLNVTAPKNEHFCFLGNQRLDVKANIRVHSWDFLMPLIKRSDIGFGESYAEGLWDTDDLPTLLTYCSLNADHLETCMPGSFVQRFLWRILNVFFRANNVRQSVRNIKAHYDIGDDFYALWLDESMTYSSALRLSPTDDLADAQKQKYARILDKIQHVNCKNILEIGCGWGGFAEQAVQKGYKLSGLTISPKQYMFARKRLEKTSANILLKDYRHIHGVFDAVVSIEMFEAVGERYWPTYFEKLRSVLKNGALAVVQTITIRDDLFAQYRKGSDYIRHYVFPGGMLSSKSMFKKQAARVGFQVKEMFSFGNDYAWTLKQWFQRLKNVEERLIGMGYSKSFIRSWKYYIALCCAGFSSERTDVVQVAMTLGTREVRR